MYECALLPLTRAYTYLYAVRRAICSSRNMAITIIIVLLVVASTTGARSLDNGRLEDRSAEAGLPPILVNFTVQRLGKDIIDANQLEQDLFFTFFYNGFNDSFCREGVDTPGNITLYTFYRCRVDNDTISDWMFLQKDSMSIGFNTDYNYTASVPMGEGGSQIAILQLDHAGGSCDSWVIIRPMFPAQTVSQASCVNHTLVGLANNAVFVGGSSSLSRGFITHWMTEDSIIPCALPAGDDDIGDIFTPPSSLPQPEELLCSNQTSPEGPYMELSFMIHWYFTGCDNIDFFDEGIELSIRRPGDFIWTPVVFYSILSDPVPINLIQLSYPTSFTMRGYNVPVIWNNNDIQHELRYRFCHDSLLRSETGIQFRWLQTVQVAQDSVQQRDIWSLDDIQVVYNNGSNDSTTVFYEGFESGDNINVSKWSGQRRGQVASNDMICNDNRPGSAVMFGNFTNHSLQSRMIATVPLCIQQACSDDDIDSPELDLDGELLGIYNELVNDVEGGIEFLIENLQDTEEVNETQVVYLTSVILDILGDEIASEELSEKYIEIGSLLLTDVSQRDDGKPPNSDAGSTLLQNLDQFGLNNHDPAFNKTTSDLLELTVNNVGGDDVIVIDDGSLSLTLPPVNVTAKAISFLYRNMSGFLDNTSPGGDNDSVLFGPVLSAVLDTPQTELQSLVVITFPHTQATTPTCVFWDFNDDVGGTWNTTGCTTTIKDDLVICECNHLTHFALLLSPGIETDEGVALSLQVIGIVGVSVSVVALVITIITFIGFRSLWSLRNYVHIQLCLSLGLAQLLFVSGVEPRGNEAACTAIAILLHYTWLVSFMWMLMEGVVLYVALVKVFDVQHLRYGILFTIISYGAPLVYMIICVPLGLVLSGDDGENHYGYDEACWLRYDTHFIWAFIIPVIIIILINVGFFIMAMVIMCRHQRKQVHLSTAMQFKHWMKASISLVVVMGITWVMGIIVFTESLLPVAYIFTIFVAFQGVIIFIVLVILSKQVREIYAKWWKINIVNSEFVSKYFSERTLSKTAETNVNTSEITSSPTSDKPRSMSNGMMYRSSGTIITQSLNDRANSIADSITVDTATLHTNTPPETETSSQ